MKQFTRFFFTTALFSFLVCIPAFSQSQKGALAELLDSEWSWRLKEFPLFATYTGNHQYNHLLDQVGVDVEAKRYKHRLKLQKQLNAIDRAGLNKENQLNYDIFGHMLNQAIEDYLHQTYYFPLTNRSGFHLSFARLPEQMPLNNESDYQNYLARLKGFGTYTDQHIELLNQAIAKGYTLPRIVMKGYEQSIKTHVVEDFSKSVFFQPFTKPNARIKAETFQTLKQEAQDLISSVVIPAYQRFFTFMVDRYLPACRESLGASELPNGKAMYNHLVAHYTTLKLTADQVHQTGLKEVKRIRAEMEEVKEKTGFKGDFAAFLKFLRTDPQFYAKTPEELMKEAAYICKMMDGKLPQLFKKLPSIPYGLKVIPQDIAPKTTAAYYQQPSGDGRNAGFYYLNTYALESRPLYALEALSFHEAVPGHHLQLAYQQELEDVPVFRRFSEVGAFVEGWALYSERLGLEVGFYTDPYRDFGRLTYEMWRACRLVVDTGLHSKKWTRQQAIDFMAQNTALSTHEVTTEVDRYISWPGQALGYKMGEIQIRELRKQAEAHLGDQFDIREFHEQILRNGAIPLEVLNTQIQSYIKHAK